MWKRSFRNLSKNSKVEPLNLTPVIILVETSGPANLGAVARSATAFGIEELRLVAPQCQVDESSRMWACYGSPLLDRLTVFQNLAEATKDLQLAVALTRREGKRRHRHHTLSELCLQVLPEYPDLKSVGLVFGNETSGLANHHLDLCARSAEIPVVAREGSLNLAHAVTVALYEFVGRKLSHPSETVATDNPNERPAQGRDLKELLRRTEETLSLADYPRHCSTLEEEMAKLQDLVFRSPMEDWEVRLLQGMLKQVRYRLTHPRVESTSLPVGDEP